MLRHAQAPEKENRNFNFSNYQLLDIKRTNRFKSLLNTVSKGNSTRVLRRLVAHTILQQVSLWLPGDPV